MAAVSTNGVTAWSFSRYNDYARCPYFFFEKHVQKNPILKFETSPAMERGSTIHKEGENYLKTPVAAKGRDKVKVPDSYERFQQEMMQLRTLDPLVEQQWGFTKDWQPATATPRDPGGWFAGDTYLRIVTDVTVVYDDNTADIIDFKTGKMYGHNQEQMDLFATGPFMKWPALTEVTTRLWYLDVPDPLDNGANVVTQVFTRKDFERIKKEWDKRIQPMFMDKKFPPKPNDKCRWCALGISKGKGGKCKFG